ncbi:MAG: peptide chain release factor H [Pseudomonadota bacterium]
MSKTILHISAGKGPKECQWVVAQLARVFVKEAQSQGLQAKLLEQSGEVEASLLLSVSGPQCASFAKDRIGTIRWVGSSPFRPQHKRKNWYVGVSLAPTFQEIPQLKKEDIAFQAIRASGPGGQHVNKTDSAVRITHKPTGLSVVSQDQRSQFANKKIALMKLAMLFEAENQANEANSMSDTWQQHQSLERGNEVRCYEGTKFKFKK